MKGILFPEEENVSNADDNNDDDYVDDDGVSMHVDAVSEDCTPPSGASAS